MENQIKLISLSANAKMTSEIAKIADAEILPTQVKRFADGEISFSGNESFTGENVYIVQSTCNPVADNLMELLICIDACKRAGANSTTCVIPYFGYSRQDKMTKARQPITAKLVADILQVAGANKIVSVDLHSEQLADFFNIPVVNLSPAFLFYKYFKQLNLENLVIVSPDHGGLVRTGVLAEKFNAPLAVIDKRRPEPNQAKFLSIVGDVKNKDCIIVDDIVDTAGTLLMAVDKLKELGAKKVYAAVTHGVLSKDASEKIKNSQIEKLVITDSIPLPKEKQNKKIEVLQLAPLLSKVIVALEEGNSIAETLDDFEK